MQFLELPPIHIIGEQIAWLAAALAPSLPSSSQARASAAMRASVHASYGNPISVPCNGALADGRGGETRRPSRVSAW